VRSCFANIFSLVKFWTPQFRSWLSLCMDTSEM
jgi:hypothetical protein